MSAYPLPASDFPFPKPIIGLDDSGNRVLRQSKSPFLIRYEYQMLNYKFYSVLNFLQNEAELYKLRLSSAA